MWKDRMVRLFALLLLVIAILSIFQINSNNYQRMKAFEEESISLREYNNEILEKNEELQDKLKEANQTIRQLKEKNVDVYEYAGYIYNEDPVLIKAIETLETGHFKSENYLNNNNTFGATSPDGSYYFYDSHEQSTMELARLLRFNYFNKGLVTLEEINDVFCPPDPEWSKKVNAIYEELKEGE